MRTAIDPPAPRNIRKIEGSFSWIDHRIVTGRWLEVLRQDEILLYLFWVLVGDRQGLSFYSNEKMASLLKISVQEIDVAREGLVQKGLIAYRKGIIQVLPIPKEES